MLAEPDERAVEALRALVRVPTVSQTEHLDPASFERLHAVLAEHFPLLHARLARTQIGEHGLLVHWPGGSGGDPLVLMAHQDVVPIDEAAPWQHPPFSAEVADGAIWGRGTLDDKGALAAVCVAVERLLEAGFTPARDVWLSFGAREEVSGVDAGMAVEELRRRGVRPWLVLDEGGAIAEQAFPGVRPALGVIGISEKGTTTLVLRAAGSGGHASTPARRGPTARIARAVVRLERRPLPPRLPDATLRLFARIAPHAPAAMRPLLAHAHRVRPLLARALVRSGPETAALARTTMAVTTLSGSPAPNVIASSATAAVNVRIMPGDSVARVTEHVRRAIGDDSIGIEVADANEPSPLSPVDDPAFDLLADLVAEVFPEAVPTPYVMMAATDARFFTPICPRVYRFTPFRMSKAQRETIHSYDERLGVDDFLAGVTWYRRLIERLPGDA